MNEKRINRIKIILAEKERTGKWLAQKLNVSEVTVSKWCTNSVQPNLNTLSTIAEVLNVSMKDLING